MRNRRNDLPSIIPTRTESVSFIKENAKKVWNSDVNFVGTVLETWYKGGGMIFGRHRLTMKHFLKLIILIAVFCIMAIQFSINFPALHSYIQQITVNLNQQRWNADFVAYSISFLIVFIVGGGLIASDSLAGRVLSLNQWRNNTWSVVVILFWAVFFNVIGEGATIYNLGNKSFESVYSAMSEEDKRRADNIADLTSKNENLEEQKKPYQESIASMQKTLNGYVLPNGKQVYGLLQITWGSKKEKADRKDDVARVRAAINADKDKLQAIDDKIEANNDKIDELKSITKDVAQTAKIIGNTSGFGLGLVLLFCLISLHKLNTEEPTSQAINERTTQVQPQVQQANERASRERANERTIERTTPSRTELSTQDIIAAHHQSHTFLTLIGEGRIQETPFNRKSEAYAWIASELGLRSSQVKGVYDRNYQERASR